MNGKHVQRFVTKGNLHCRLAVLSCPVTARRQSINVNGDLHG